MMARLLEGKDIALAMQARLRRRIKRLSRMYPKKTITLAVLSIGNNARSSSYARSQKRLAASLGIAYVPYDFPERTPTKKIERCIASLNRDSRVTGILISRPLPAPFSFKRLIERLDPTKDAEGLHPENIGRLAYGTGAVYPCTPQAVMRLLEEYRVDLYGRDVVIVGHSYSVGRPLSLLLLEKMATTTVCHIATSERRRLRSFVKGAEVLIVAAGVPNLIKGTWIKKGTVVVDVGFNVVNGKVIGDVEFSSARRQARLITPVPGGVGPITVTVLMNNVVELFRLKVTKR
ncbi:MAG: bifunctional 5,10-methylenetetrahydrofolate dehydrogenase/5,10-methenyltetrahydrofolate cyclohydrolase [Candidatus Omnitrophica bacterium]|nr:bifunctional 5,10-methylenetetrahydrofolate dehydrogenase/5,10-methenyltetrahydrofolate cyclohydrolase [Candidatus Omnitrophota bacterium]